MAHLWVSSEDGRWGVLELSQDRLDLPPGRRVGDPARGVFLQRCGSADNSWLLMASAESRARVNGLPVTLGLRVLEDRDEIVLDTARFFFSTEILARVEPFAEPEGDREIKCARCHQVIEQGSPAVRCPHPRCRLWHHQSDKLPCWTYHERCGNPNCEQPTAFGAGFSWTPEEL